MRAPIYLDYAATTPVRPEVLAAMEPFFGARFGNPSSVHRWGREARAALDEARERLAQCLGASADEIAFTSGGTEADNLAILGAWNARRPQGARDVVTSPTEHKAVLGAVHAAATLGASEQFIQVDSDGVVQRDHAASLVTEQTAVCSVMWVNNETGVVADITDLAALCAHRGALLHTDAVQAFGKVPVDVSLTKVDLLSISGHKLGAPKGIGALYVRRGVSIVPLVHGGSQNRGVRPGTENVAFAVGLARAAELAIAELHDQSARLAALRGTLEAGIRAAAPDATVQGARAQRAPHICSVSIPGTDSESLLMALDLQGVACSAGSACQSGSVTPSHVLTAMGLSTESAVSTIRLSLGIRTTADEVDRFVAMLPGVLSTARRLTGAAH